MISVNIKVVDIEYYPPVSEAGCCGAAGTAWNYGTPAGGHEG